MSVMMPANDTDCQMPLADTAPKHKTTPAMITPQSL
jgi:hypothetical protein